MTTDMIDDPITVTKSKKVGGVRRINNTNLSYAAHHYRQARISLDRATTMMNELGANSGRAGEMARDITEASGSVNTAILDLEADVQDLTDELRAFFGK